VALNDGGVGKIGDFRL